MYDLFEAPGRSVIDVLCPVLNRHGNAQPFADSLEYATTVPYTLLFLCTPGDDDQIKASLGTGADVWFVEGESAQFARKINRGFQVTENPWLLLLGDDVNFQPGWDETALTVARVSGVSVIGTDDCANPHVTRGDFSTATLVKRAYVDEVGATWDDGPGVVLHEQYDHNYCDVELAQVAKARGEWAFAPDAKIVHRHPGWRTAEDDATYMKGRATFAADRRLFARRSRMWQKHR